jgi:diguanylate cyclase (GGDEF)-like protein
VIVYDVDFFKKINDSYGHDGGDRVLQHIAQIVSGIGRHQDRIGRVGGEELMMVLPGADLDRASIVAERLRHQVEQAPVVSVGDGVVVTISIGVATKTKNDLQLSDLIARADRALYCAKHHGRNRVERDDTTGGDA